ncbi:hypothetical protein [Tardiphaga sp.]|uniref:hypothetical protein n=1 Tax=Tardiphaga sp. TaxID=1926292 RepID=UPI00261D307C|nr:hypothetical protein [Tardiphaga sp.]MDB5616048.1 hypothetical protein [Tardiphaga sp.]
MSNNKRLSHVPFDLEAYHEFKREVGSRGSRASIPNDANSPHTPSEQVRAALLEAERFMAYFAGETGGTFVGSGTPITCLEKIRAALTVSETLPCQSELMVLVRHAFNVGMVAGMKEFTSSKGGATWQECKPDLESRLAAICAPTPSLIRADRAPEVTKEK